MVSRSLLSGLFSTPAVDRIFSDEQHIQSMLRFEAALSAAVEDCAIAPPGSSAPVAALLAASFLTPERATHLHDAARAAGNLAIPFVKLLTQAVAETAPQAAAFIHLGATSQDVLDTALCLQLQAALPLLDADLQHLRFTCGALAAKHAHMVMAGRTWLQQGPPITLGLKVAGWLAALDRHAERLSQTSARCLRLQFGGAVGTLASLGDRGAEVSRALSDRLGLPEAEIPWHTHRDNFTEIACTLGNLTGTLGKIARDLSLLMQTEVGELLEPAADGRGGSSTMPHKRNPVGSAAVLAAAARVPALVATMLAAMPQEHERGLGGWQAEWETLPDICRLTAGALAQMNDVAAGLEIHPGRMAANLSISHGLILAEAVSAALAPTLGRAKAHALLETAAKLSLQDKSSLRDALLAMPEVMQVLSEDDLARLLDPVLYLGSTQHFIARVLSTRQGE